MSIDCRWRGDAQQRFTEGPHLQAGVPGDTPGPRRSSRLWTGLRAVCGAAVATLAACGGGDGSGASGDSSGTNGTNGTNGANGDSCSVREQQDALSAYMADWYFWYRLSPRPVPAAHADVLSFFKATLYTGNDAAFPADRWSGRESTASFNRFFADGQNLGYGVSVAGLEVAGQPAQPLYVRGVDPGSPAAVAGVMRGDRVLALNGRAASDVIGADDFSALSAIDVGQVLDLRVQRGLNILDLRLVSAVYAVVPVGEAQLYVSQGRRRMGYLPVKAMISQAQAPIEQAFAQFKALQVQDLVLDLRYNGGGLVSVGAHLASHMASVAAPSSTYAALLFNDQRAAASNQTYRFSAPASALALSRVYVLTGPRTCSASEQVINGLRGVGVEVISVGDTTCGKPVGFVPTSRCGQTYSVVNFESVNARNEGRYWDGFDASCPVAENWQVAQGSVDDPLRWTATWLADGGSCAAAASSGVQAADGRKSLLSAKRKAGLRLKLDERSDLLGR